MTEEQGPYHGLKLILVLEDLPHRVEQLRKWVGVGAKITHVETVKGFQDAFRMFPWDLIILDHDLGPGSDTSEDENGNTGMDAVRLIPPNYDVPVLVWSANSYAGPAMAVELNHKHVTAVAVPFLEHKFSTLSRIVRGIIYG